MEDAEGAEDWPGPPGDSDLEEDSWPGPPRPSLDLTPEGEDDWPGPPMDQTPKDLPLVLEAALNLDPSSQQQVHQEGEYGSGPGLVDPHLAAMLTEGVSACCGVDPPDPVTNS